jgi:flagellar basal-body rod modification protein FlgD
MHKVSANYTLPTVLNTLKPAATSGLARAVTGKTTPAPTPSSPSSNSTTGDLTSTFLNLLSQELQNQDPTAPVDSTAMVGQMISLNQLDQLISINQALTSSSATGTTATGSAQTAQSGAAAPATSNSGVAGLLSPSTAGAASNQLPFDPNTMMPLTSGNAGAVSAAIKSSLNAATLGISGTNNNALGGK